MGDHDRLDKGFVNWQGARVFAPWFGPLRTVPSAEDEVGIVKLRERAHLVMAIGFLPVLALLAVAAWLLRPVLGHIPPGDHTVLIVMLCLVAVFGPYWRIERKRTQQWPAFPANRHVFLTNYYRGLSRGERLSALGWSGVGALICISAFVHYVGLLSPIGILCAVAGPLPLGVITGEHVAGCLRAVLEPGMAQSLPPDAGHS